MKTFIINLGGTSSKVALYDGELPTVKGTIRHDSNELKDYRGVWEQYEYRKESILKFCSEHAIILNEVDLFVSRGPSVKPLESGVYAIDEQMIEDAKSKDYGLHVCNLGCAIASELAQQMNVLALTADPPCVDEMIPVAKYTGLPQIKRRSFFQALSHKALGRKLAEKLGKPYEEMALVIVHLGSGISVASHYKGRVIDITNGLDGDAPFGMDRSGTLPAADWKKMIQSGDYTEQELDYMLNGGGGLMAHLGTNDGMEVQRRIEKGDAKASEVFEAMAFQVSKAIGAAATALGERPDQIAITGGLAHARVFTDLIRERVDWIAGISIEPDIDELDALAAASIAAYQGKRAIKKY